MKKTLLILIWAVAFSTYTYGQETPDEKGNVMLEMADGRILQGWNRTDFKNDNKTIKFTTLEGERVNYEIEEVNKVVFLSDSTEYVKVGIIPYLMKKTPTSDKWVRVEYRGNGITIYSRYLAGKRAYNNPNSYQQVKQRNYYIQLGDDPAMMVTSEYYAGGVANLKATNRKQLQYYFKKKYPQYADFAKRIKEKEFETVGMPLEVVKAWEAEYAGK